MLDFAKVKDGKITQTYNSDKQYIDDNGIRFPQSIWRNKEYLKTQNLYYIQNGSIPNKLFYDIGGSILSFDSVADTVTRSYTSSAKSNESIKKYFHDLNISTFKGILESTNYHILRSQEDSDYKIPSSVSTWRAKINTEFDNHQTAIEACDSISKFQALNIIFTDKPEDVI